jgi:Ca-activated chloride channel family protein
MLRNVLKFLSLWWFISVSVTFANPKAMIIFDASGSMWGQIDGANKIVIAKEALKSVIKDWDENTELGLTVYGHRRKGDCNDIEIVFPIAKIKSQEMIRRVFAINPKGKTPIAKSLEMVANSLREYEDKTAIILISDGKESCDSNPCDMVKKLKDSGIDFLVYAVGFNVDESADRELRCIARESGGEYFSAKNALELNSAIENIVQNVQKPKPKPKPKKFKKPKFDLEIRAKEREGGEDVGEATHYIYKIVDGEAKNNKTTYCLSKAKKPCQKKIPSGTYLIVSKYNKFEKRTEIKVDESNLTKLVVIMGETGKVKIIAKEKEEGRWVEAVHYIYKIVDGEVKSKRIDSCRSTKKEPCIIKLPIGKYMVLTKYNKFKIENEVELNSSKILTLNVIAGETGKFTTSITVNGKSSGGYIYVYDDKDRTNSVGYKAFRDRSAEIKLPAGHYYITIKHKEKKVYREIDIKPAQNSELKVDFYKSTIKFKCPNPEKDRVHIEIFSDDGQMVDSRKVWCSRVYNLMLDKGKYRAESILNDTKKSVDFEVGSYGAEFTVDFTQNQI